MLRGIVDEEAKKGSYKTKKHQEDPVAGVDDSDELEDAAATACSDSGLELVFGNIFDVIIICDEV